MFCNKCGSMLPDGTKFCTSCGAPQANPATRVNTEFNNQPRSDYSAASAPSVGLVDAIQLFFARYADFSGRSRRSEYWYATLFLLVVNGLLGAIFSDKSIFITVWSLATLIPSLAVMVRRLHDAGRSGLYWLWNLLPLAGWIIVLVALCTDSVPVNQWGPNPKR